MGVFDRFPTPPCEATLGWRLLDADSATGAVRIAFEGKPVFCNPGGTIQGGFLAAMLDDTLGPTILVRTDGTFSCATIDPMFNFSPQRGPDS